MTINETSFFRDSRPFELLRTELLPRSSKAAALLRTLRFWSAACSTGQEAYSIGMLLLEHFPSSPAGTSKSKAPTSPTKSSSAARAGTYHRIEMNRGLPARNIVRFFDHHGEDWTVKAELRGLCNFRQANLCGSDAALRQTASTSSSCATSCSTSPRKRANKLLANIHRLLAPDGILFLGSSEQPADPSIWTSHLAGGTCYFRPRQPS